MPGPSEILAALEASAECIRAACNAEYAAQIAKAAELIIEAYRNGRKLLVFGNGGSSSDAMHIAAELVGRFSRERKGLPAIALTANQAVLTAWSNDYSFDTVFERQIEALGQPGDVAWGISTSGNSGNVVRACDFARRNGIRTIGMTGSSGGRLAPHADVLLAAPAEETPRIQEIHLITCHTICAIVESSLFPL